MAERVCLGGAARFRFPGRLAQLGERQLDKLEVTGSSPVAPIGPCPGSRRAVGGKMRPVVL
jgi:hypothetical protein